MVFTVKPKAMIRSLVASPMATINMPPPVVEDLELLVPQPAMIKTARRNKPVDTATRFIWSVLLKNHVVVTSGADWALRPEVQQTFSQGQNKGASLDCLGWMQSFRFRVAPGVL
jgi:hypothetical protein